MIGIEQDCELDYDGEVGNHLPVFWCEGHGHDGTEFVRAVVEHCIDYGEDIPAIEWDATPVEMWQTDRDMGDAVEYVRAAEIPSGDRRDAWRPVTVLDLWRRCHGATKCSVNGCSKPWDSGQPIQIVTEVDGPYTALTMWLCREHRELLPEPSYRLRFVPVGSTIMLSPPATPGGEG